MGILLLILGAGLLFFGLIPLVFYFNTNIGVLALLAGGTFSIIAGWTWQKGKLGAKLKRTVIAIYAAAGLVIILILVPMMRVAYLTPPPDTGEFTVIVLGCQINGDQPSLMLARRLDAALAYLEEKPQANAVLSGGYGDGLDLSEAEVMRNYLVQRGVDTNRLYLEDRSRNTRQNIAYSAEIIEAHGLSRDVVIATDGFHQYRAKMSADRTPGIGEVYATSSANTPWGLRPAYYIREMLGILFMRVTGTYA